MVRRRPREPDLEQIVCPEQIARRSIISEDSSPGYCFQTPEAVVRRQVGEFGIIGQRMAALRQTAGFRQHDRAAHVCFAGRIAGRFDAPDRKVEMQINDIVRMPLSGTAAPRTRNRGAFLSADLQ